MPKEGISVYFSGVDQMSPVLSSLADKTRALDKESQELQQTYNAMQKANQLLIEQRTTLKASLEEQKNRVSELRAEYKKYGDDMSGLKMQLAIEEQDALKDKLREVEDQLSANRKIFKENREEIRKGLLEGDGGGLGGGEQGTSLNDMAKGLVAGQVGQMFASSMGNFLETKVTSALGVPTASLLSDTVSGIIAGAAAGSIIPGIGTAIGAAVGGVSGALSGYTKIWEAEDDAFKDYYGGLYDDVKGRSEEMVEAGSTIAGGREQTRMAFSQRLGGDEQAADYLAQVEKMAASTNYEYDEIVGYAKLLLNSYKAKTEVNDDGTKETDVMDVLMALSDATAGLNLSSSDVNMMISGLSRMRTTGKATQEYLNYFRERGIDTDQALVEYYADHGRTVQKGDLADMVRKGDVGGEDAAQAILEFIQTEFGGLSDGLAGTYDAMVDNLGDITASLQAQGGDAYNELRKEGIQAEINALGGDDGLGDAIGEINRIMGENQARKENLQEQYMREVRDAVLNGNQGELWDALDKDQQFDLLRMHGMYDRLMKQYRDGDTGAGAELESLYEQAEALGQAYFENSDFMQKLNDVEVDEITAIRDMTAGLNEATQAAYNVSQALSKGYGAVDMRPREYYTLDMKGKTQGAISGVGHAFALAGSNSHAFGLPRVPYDEYPALLHRDERVLTASEARAQDAGQGAAPTSLTVTGNNFIGAPEELADQIWEIIVRRLEQAAVAAAPK